MRILIVAAAFFGLSFVPVFSKTIELTTSANFYTADALRATTLANLSLTYHINSLFWIGTDASAGYASSDRGNSLDIGADDSLYILDGAFYWNLPALLNADLKNQSDGLSADFYTSVGGGHLWIGNLRAPFGFIGGGLIIDTSAKWFSVRFDLKNLFYSLENRGGTDFNSDLGLCIGTSFNF